MSTAETPATVAETPAPVVPEAAPAPAPVPAPRRRRLRFLPNLDPLALVAILALGAGLTVGREALTAETPPAPRPVAAAQPAAAVERRPVIVETVRFAPRVPERTFVGTVRPRIETDVGFRVAGKIAERLVQQGERVRAGQPLFRLDPADFALQRRQAEAEVRAARVNLDQSVANERRTVELRRNGWTTDAVLERAQAQTAEARGRLERGEQALQLASNQLAYATLTADADGVVTATLAEPGQVVAAGAPVARIARSGEVEAVVAVPEILIERVRQGSATVTLWSQAGRTYRAQLREFAAAADPASRTFQARFTILEADAAVALGMTATVAVAEPGSRPVARLPMSALHNTGQGPGLWVVDAGTGALAFAPVAVEGYEGREVLISSGVPDGAQVVTLGVQRLDAGQRVRIVELRS